MSTSVIDSVRQQLAFLGLDDVALQDRSAAFAMDRFDYWVNSGSGTTRSCTCTGCCRIDDLSAKAS